MTTAIGTLPEYLKFEKKRYLKGRAEKGGTATGFRSRVAKLAEGEPEKFVAFQYEALMEAATRAWQAQPRKRGPDLFDLNGVTIPEYLTRPMRGALVDGEDIAEDDETKFEKVDHSAATVNDLYEDARIKMRKAARSAAVAENLYQAADEARRRAGGDLSAFLRDLADKAA